MMKKLLILMLVLGFTSVASAVPYFVVNPAQDSYMPSEWVTIELLDDNVSPVAGFMVDCITDNTGGLVLGTAGEPQYMDPSFAFPYPGTLNVNNQLVEYAAGAASSAGVPAGTVIYSFEYHVPDVPASTWIEIQNDADYDLYWDAWMDYADASYYEGSVGTALIHVIPEPTTIVLLGLGGLLLRRRRK